MNRKTLLVFPENLQALCIDASSEELIHVRYTDPIDTATTVRFRFFLAREYHAQGKVELCRPDSSAIGSVSISYGYLFQPFEIEFNLKDAMIGQSDDPGQIAFILRHIASISGSDVPFCLIQEYPSVTFFKPYVYAVPDSLADIRLSSNQICVRIVQGLSSRQTLQPFGWIEGAVIDGLIDLLESPNLPGSIQEKLRGIITFHLETYFQPDGALRYMGPDALAKIDELYGIEAMLPFASSFRMALHHPATGLFKNMIDQLHGDDGLIIDREWDPEGLRKESPRVSIEGCYTVAYPVSLYARKSGNTTLYSVAKNQIEKRLEHLFSDGVVYQRAYLEKKPQQGSWARSYCWFLLGTIKTLYIIRSNIDVSGLERVWKEITTALVKAQREDGLFNTYLNDDDSGPDVSASAGIGAAMVLGYSYGLLDSDILEVANSVLTGLGPYLVDGNLLAGVSQLNRGGDDFQRTAPKVIGQFALGLAGQLVAALNTAGSRLNFSDV